MSVELKAKQNVRLLERRVKDSAALQQALLDRRGAPCRAQVQLNIGVLVRTERSAWGTTHVWPPKSKPIGWGAT